MDRTLIAVVEGGCGDCDRVMQIVESVRRDNSRTGLEVERVDVWADDARARDLGVLEHPTIVVVTNGRERARLVGRVTHRQILRKLLPQLHADRAIAREELRRQLESPAEDFPSRRGGFAPRRLGEKLERLRSMELFAGLSGKQLRAVARVADEMPVAAGQTIVTEGDDGDSCFVIVEGSCEVRRSGRKLDEVGPGRCIGEMAIVDPAPRSATVTATADTELLVIDGSDFEVLLAEVDGLARAVMAQLARRLREADRRLVG